MDGGANGPASEEVIADEIGDIYSTVTVLARVYPTHRERWSMRLREPTTNDAERIHELTRSSMTASYSLSPQQIENVISEEFDEGRMTDLGARSDGYVFALEDEEFETLVGFVEGHLDGDTGEIRWILEDPEHRGKRRRRGTARSDPRKAT